MVFPKCQTRQCIGSIVIVVKSGEVAIRVLSVEKVPVFSLLGRNIQNKKRPIGAQILSMGASDGMHPSRL